MDPTTRRNRKCKGVIAAVAVLSFVTFPISAQAAQSWWEKGVSIFNSAQGGSDQQSSGTLTSTEVSAAFQEALRIGSSRVVDQLGRVDGFNLDPAIHIPLPQSLVTVKSVLARIGMSGLADELELKLNRAAEAATPKAKDLFLQAIKEMTFDDVMGIYKGPEDAATRYFQKKMSPALAEEMRPIVTESLAQVGAIQVYDSLISKYRTVPMVPDVKANLTDYAVEKGMDGIFHYLAEEEAAIRRDPARQTTDLLRRVFGAMK